MPEVLFERPYALIQWEAEFNRFYIQIRGFVQGPPFREILEQALELLKAKEAHRWIIDVSEQKVTALEDQNWVAKDWVPRCSEAGLTFGATVVPKDILGLMSLTRIGNSLAENTTRFGSFFSLEEAQQWLTKK